jgi:putative SOS response-associated peptidase YedK
VQKKDRSLFALAGLWEPWMGADGSELETAVLMTIAPNAELATIHDRMPAIIEAKDYETWLTGDAEAAAKLLRPAPDDSFTLEPTVIGRAAPPKPEPPKPRQMTLL